MSHISGNERLNEVKQNLALLKKDNDATKSVAGNTEKLREGTKTLLAKIALA